MTHLCLLLIIKIINFVLAEPVIRDALKNAGEKTYFIYVDVGERT